MKFLSKVFALSATTGLAVMGGAGIAAAHGHGAGAHASGAAVGSPGVVSGNVVQFPIDVPINVCGNTVDIFIAALNPAFGNKCINK